METFIYHSMVVNIMDITYSGLLEKIDEGKFKPVEGFVGGLIEYSMDNLETLSMKHGKGPYMTRLKSLKFHSDSGDTMILRNQDMKMDVYFKTWGNNGYLHREKHNIGSYRVADIVVGMNEFKEKISEFNELFYKRLKIVSGIEELNGSVSKNDIWESGIMGFYEQIDICSELQELGKDIFGG